MESLFSFRSQTFISGSASARFRSDLRRQEDRLPDCSDFFGPIQTGSLKSLKLFLAQNMHIKLAFSEALAQSALLSLFYSTISSVEPPRGALIKNAQRRG